MINPLLLSFYINISIPTLSKGWQGRLKTFHCGTSERQTSKTKAYYPYTVGTMSTQNYIRIKTRGSEVEGKECRKWRERTSIQQSFQKWERIAEVRVEKQAAGIMLKMKSLCVSWRNKRNRNLGWDRGLYSICCLYVHHENRIWFAGFKMITNGFHPALAELLQGIFA